MAYYRIHLNNEQKELLQKYAPLLTSTDDEVRKLGVNMFRKEKFFKKYGNCKLGDYKQHYYGSTLTQIISDASKNLYISWTNKVLKELTSEQRYLWKDFPNRNETKCIIDGKLCDITYEKKTS